MSSSPLRRIRSFVRREGRLTPGQNDALNTLWPIYGLDAAQPLDEKTQFPNGNPMILEIGFGSGHSLHTMAQNNPNNNYIGIEVHRPGVGSLLVQLKDAPCKNIKLYATDAVEILEHCIADQSLTGVQIFFPDPWHKKRHHKRRLIQPDFINLLGKKVHPQGWVHLATDWQPYAEHMVDIFTHSPLWTNEASPGPYLQQPTERPRTRFEARGERLGHAVFDLRYHRTSIPAIQA